ncbi:MAG: hypothetical protein NZM11_06765 [Anaerolineales bacterium]|nr:hypothetical protein [Anaerolineales bacterium]
MDINKALSAAHEDFRRARQQAAMEDLLAHWQGKSPNLLSFEEVRRKLRATGMSERGLREIPLGHHRHDELLQRVHPHLSAAAGAWTKNAGPA